MSINRALLAILIIYHALFLAFLPVGKRPYSEAVVGYLAAYPLIYLMYLIAVSLHGRGKGEGPEVAVGFALVYLLIFAPFFAVGRGWEVEWSAWLEYIGGSLLVIGALILEELFISDAKPQDRARLIRAIAPLLVLHVVYALVALAGRADRPVLWYFATYPAALAAAVAGGGRQATLAATAICLAAYLLDAVPLLLLLIAVPAAWRPAANGAAAEQR